MFFSPGAHSTVQHRSTFFLSMYSIIVILWIVSNIMADRQFNSTDISMRHPCLLCLSTALIFNCSSYSFDLPVIDNCSEIFIWKIVDFTFRNLTSLTSEDLLFLRMEQLILSFNSLTHIEKNTFDSLGEILLDLDLSMNDLSNNSIHWLNSNLIQLKKLNLADNQMIFFSPDVQLPALEYLNLSHNLIHPFPSSIHRWTSLTILDLSFNHLSTIPRFALMGLNNLTWLSLASNRNLTCKYLMIPRRCSSSSFVGVIQDSFKYLKSLKHLDLSSTNLFELDGCIFVQLIALQTLHIDHLSLNCTSCWLVIARKNALFISGQCLANDTLRQFDTLTDYQLDEACSTTSIDCSKDYCEPGSIISHPFSPFIRTSGLIKTPLKIIILVVMILIIVKSLILVIIRWRKDGRLFCCYSKEKSIRRDQRKKIIDSNPAVIESVVTHGANMNLSTHSHYNAGYSNDETSKNKRKLYNPMFADSPTLDVQQDDSPDNTFYSERL